MTSKSASLHNLMYALNVCFFLHSSVAGLVCGKDRWCGILWRHRVLRHFAVAVGAIAVDGPGSLSLRHGIVGRADERGIGVRGLCRNTSFSSVVLNRGTIPRHCSLSNSMDGEKKVHGCTRATLICNVH